MEMDVDIFKNLQSGNFQKLPLYHLLPKCALFTQTRNLISFMP